MTTTTGELVALLGDLVDIRERLAEADGQRAQLSRERDRLVREVRGRGASWSRIAAAAGRSITRCVAIVGGG